MTTSAIIFSRFCTAYGITHERPMFHTFASQRYPIGWTWTVLKQLWSEYNKFGRAGIIAAQDARDHAETCAAALR